MWTVAACACIIAVFFFAAVGAWLFKEYIVRCWNKSDMLRTPSSVPKPIGLVLYDVEKTLSEQVVSMATLCKRIEQLDAIVRLRFEVGESEDRRSA